ncbi:MAG: acetyl-CoA hydrolase/transferase C-terminal domain-containing protein [Parvibaculaceae bacterium]
MDSHNLLSFASNNTALLFRSVSQTHSLGIISALPKFSVINSAVEVGLSGQVNTEAIGTKYVGSVGGAVGFIRGANVSDGGISIIALPSTAGVNDEKCSQITLALNGSTSIARSDTYVVVTEYRVADLRGVSIQERRRSLLKIAHPDFRDMLEAK